MKAICLFLMLICLGFSARADTVPSQPPAAETLSPALPDAVKNVTSYVSPTIENIARVYWALNAHRLDDDEMIDNFLHITECDLYTKFNLNEFQWRKIRSATRDYLTKYKGSFARRFEYVQPLFLDRYDFNLKGFGIMPDYQFTPSTRMEFASDMNHTAQCDRQSLNEIKGYPGGAELTLRQPFKLNFVRVSQPLAEEYLKMMENIDQKKGRPAFIRFRIRIDRLLGTTYISQQEYSNFGGAIESIEVFADRDLMFKLYEQTLY